jgi:hypothetical protein
MAESMGNTSPRVQNPEAVNLNTGTTMAVTNTATIGYLQRIGSMEKPVILDVGGEGGGMKRNRENKRRAVVALGPQGKEYHATRLRSSKISMILYLAGPVLTVVAMTLMILTRDWWGVGIICALMLARVLNIWIIRQRIKVKPAVAKTPNIHENWWVNLDGNNICLRGLAHDLDAITTGSWMRDKTNIEGYVEAMAKLIVYMVAVFSGNVFQTGNIILLVLLLSSAALLALSNARSDTFSMNGRVATVTDQVGDGKKPTVLPTNSADLSVNEVGRPGRDPRVPVGLPIEQDDISVGGQGIITGAYVAGDFEQAETKEVIETTYPFNGEVNYV